MSLTKLNIEEFLLLAATVKVLDVRSPGEYAQAHIPGALSFPLFTDAERKSIGTSYKQDSRKNAIKLGLAAFGSNLVAMVEAAEKLVDSKTEAPPAVIVHCWRGGMRSAAVAWLLDLYGFDVYVLTGGYKSYRRWALKQFEKHYPLKVIGGYTGSNKTGLLQALKKTGASVIDLEALAGHMGSAFGNLDRSIQPSQEQFENRLAFELHSLSSATPERIIWLENESQRIGNINLPLSFFQYFSTQPSYFIDVPFEQRLQHVVSCYGSASKETLINAIVRISKKLGGLEAKTAVALLMDNEVAGCFSILLHYYDKLYRKSELKYKQDERQMTTLPCPGTDAGQNLEILLNHVTTH